MTVKISKSKTAASIVLAALALSLININSVGAADIAVSVNPSNPYRDYQVYSSGGDYQIRVLGFDPVAQLYSGTTITGFNIEGVQPSGNYLAFDDDGGGFLPDRNSNRDSFLEGTLTSGDYVIRVTSYGYWGDDDDATESYTLRYVGFSSGTSPPAATPAPAPAPAPVFVRQSANLSFAQSLFASDTLSDPDGQLRKTVDQIMAKHGSLIK